MSKEAGKPVRIRWSTADRRVLHVRFVVDSSS